MKKNILMMSLLMAGVVVSNSADAFYVGGSFGSSDTKINSVTTSGDASYSIYAGMGIPLPLIPIRAEVEYFDFNSSENDADIKTMGAVANAYVGLPLLPILKPYVGFGVGYMKQDVDMSGTSFDSDWKVAPQYMIGVDLDLPLIPVAGGIEYRHIDTSFENSSGSYDSKIQTVTVKARYKF